MVIGVEAGEEGSGSGGSVSGGGDRSTGVGRVVRMPAYPTDAEWVAALGDAKERVVVVSSGIAAFCTFTDASVAKKFDDVMSTALQAESHFCGHGSGGHARSCEIGFDVPKGTGVEADCAAMRRAAAAAGAGGVGDAFRARYTQIGKHQDSR